MDRKHLREMIAPEKKVAESKVDKTKLHEFFRGASEQFERNPRGFALELVDEGLVDARNMLSMALGYMSNDDVRGMLDANELSPRFGGGEEI